MEHTPLKSISLRSTPKGKVDSMDLDATPKKVRFSLKGDYQKALSIGKENKIYKAEDVLSMLNDSSLSEDGETSSDEEWIVTKSKALRISDTPLKENDVSPSSDSTSLQYETNFLPVLLILMKIVILLSIILQESYCKSNSLEVIAQSRI